MDRIFEAIEEWMRNLLTGMVSSNLTTMYTDVNEKTGQIAAQVGQTPQGWNGNIFSMIQNLSDSVIVPIAGMIIGIEAENIREARPKLERIESDIMNNFKILGVTAYPLNGAERLQIMYETFNQDSKVPFHFSYDEVLRTGLSTKDYIAPTSFVFKNGKDFQMGGTIGAVSYLQILAPELTDKMLAEFLEMDSNLMVNFHIQSIDQMKAIKLVKSKVTDINRMKIEEQKKAVRAGYDMDIIPSDLNTYGGEAKRLPVMGEYHNNLTLEEAIKIYESIPADRLHGGKGIGFDLQDGDEDYSGEYELMSWDRVDRELIDMIPHYKESPLVQKAINDMEKYLNEKHGKVQEAEQTVEMKQEVPEAPVKKESVSVEPNQTQKREPAKGEKGELKKSVLQSLKEFQARAKAQEQKEMTTEKSKARKKGDVEL